MSLSFCKKVKINITKDINLKKNIFILCSICNESSNMKINMKYLLKSNKLINFFFCYWKINQTSEIAFSIQLRCFARSVYTTYWFKSHDFLSLSERDNETSPRKWYFPVSEFNICRPLPLSPLHGPLPFLLPAQNVRFDVIITNARLLRKQSSWKMQTN